MNINTTVDDNSTGPDLEISFSTRFPIKQTGRNTFKVCIPYNAHATPIINDKVAENLKLSEKEYKLAEEAALKAIAIIQ